MDKVLYENLVSLRDAITTELKRRGISVTYTGTGVDEYVLASDINECIAKLDGVKTSKLRRASVDEEIKHYDSDIRAYVKTLASYPKVGGSSSCNSGCTGLCVGCSGTCQSGCTSCSGTCSSSCNNSCSGACKGCSNCTGH